MGGRRVSSAGEAAAGGGAAGAGAVGYADKRTSLAELSPSKTGLVLLGERLDSGAVEYAESGGVAAMTVVECLVRRGAGSVYWCWEATTEVECLV